MVVSMYTNEFASLFVFLGCLCIEDGWLLFVFAHLFASSFDSVCVCMSGYLLLSGCVRLCFCLLDCLYVCLLFVCLSVRLFV